MNFPAKQQATGILTPHRHDVLLGRGGASNHHHGNAVFRAVVAKTRPLYQSAQKKQKIVVAQSIVTAVASQNPPGRFLERDKRTKLWCEVSYTRAVEKAKQALREQQRQEKGTTPVPVSVPDTAASAAVSDEIHPTDSSVGKSVENLVRWARRSSENAVKELGEDPEAVLSGGGAPSVPASAPAPAPTPSSDLSPEDEAVSTPYRNMLGFNVPPATVRAKMEAEKVPDHIISSVLEPDRSGRRSSVQIAFSPIDTPTPSPASSERLPAARRKRNSSSMLRNFRWILRSRSEEWSDPELLESLPPEVVQVVDEITNVDAGGLPSDDKTEPSRKRQNRRRSSLWNIFRRRSRQVKASDVKPEQMANMSILLSESSRKELLKELNWGRLSLNRSTKSTPLASPRITATSTAGAGMADAAQAVAVDPEVVANLSNDDLVVEPADHRNSMSSAIRPSLVGKLLSVLGKPDTNDDLSEQSPGDLRWRQNAWLRSLSSLRFSGAKRGDDNSDSTEARAA